ncbi:PEST proteolytic signal-containing nuclear protein [Strongylocentrotus purpuratus]|uniref:PEST proteolytic signal-containing nuclear protein n=1 Tax=Strongylocentrotus purpuratus TaxID=7668 RepID=A0A7M7LU39_STRPU|nr:PEST proteolytic signal-containing nuclear protein [Strongylocentrotus purpuratus]XP_011683554.2 PEST proteolytic signal-containing nuclear protein [Strongylocentrotus purpuratus]
MSDKEAILKRKPSDEQETDGTKKSKLSFNIGLKKSPAVATENKTFNAKPLIKPKIRIAPVSIKLGASKPKEPEKKILKPSGTAAKAFADESDEDEEDMPPEAKMRMKNMGRDTPTSAGPNSFNKGKMGFSSPSAKWKTPRLKSNAEHPLEEHEVEDTS